MSQQSGLCRCEPKLEHLTLTVKNTFLECRFSEEDDLQRSKSCPQFAEDGASPIIGSFGWGEDWSPRTALLQQLDETSSMTTLDSDGAQDVNEFDSTPSDSGWAESSSCQNLNPFSACAAVAQLAPVLAEQSQTSFQELAIASALAEPIPPQPQHLVTLQLAPQCLQNQLYYYTGCDAENIHMQETLHHANESKQGSSSGKESDDSSLWPRPSTSAARRLRRKRAAERLPGVGHREMQSDTCKNHRAKDFGPELYDTMQMQLSGGSEKGLQDALASMRGQVWSLSRSPVGCRLVQLALDNASQYEVGKLAEELRGHVVEASNCPHANYVLQKVLTHLTFSTASFVAEELAGNAARVARSRYGCRIFCRLLEFFGTHATTLQLLDELLAHCEDLCCHSFAHHAIQSVLEHGDGRHRSRVMAALLTDPLAYAQHKNASYLVEQALCHCSPEDKQALLVHLRSPDAMSKLVVNQFGYYVACTVMKQAPGA